MLEKLRDEGKKDNEVKYGEENDERISPIVDIENAEIEWEDEHNCYIWSTERDGEQG